jgi:hypothetical protein
VELRGFEPVANTLFMQVNQYFRVLAVLDTTRNYLRKRAAALTVSMAPKREKDAHLPSSSEGRWASSYPIFMRCGAALCSLEVWTSRTSSNRRIPCT